MATETQNKFRKQMKELKDEQKGTIRPQVYSYIEKDFVDNRIHLSKRRIISFSGIIAFIVLLFYAYPFILSALGHVTAYNQKPVIAYLEQIKVYDREMKTVTESINENIKNVKMQSPDSRKQFTDSMKNLLNSVHSMSVEASEINPPKGLEEHKNQITVRCQDLSNAISFFAQGVSNNDQDSFNKGNNAINQYNIDAKKQISLLMSAFDKYNIKYRINDDGSIQYEYKNFN
jgi:hypothetical protein